MVNRTNYKLHMLFLLITLRFLLPAYIIEKIGPTSTAILGYISIFTMLAYVFFNTFRLSKYSLLIILIYVQSIVVTAMQEGRVFEAFFRTLTVSLFCLVLSGTFENELHLDALLHVVRNIVLMFFIINIIATIIYPNGIPDYSPSISQPYFLYSNVNSTLRNIIPGMCCSCILDVRSEKKISIQTLIFFLGFFYTSIKIYIMATALIGMFLLLIFIIFQNLFVNNISKIYLAVLISVGLFELVIVIFGMNSTFAMGINAIFGKTDNFSGRGSLWFNCLEAIKSNLVWGHGVQESEYVFKMIGNSSGSHNYYLDAVFQRGIIGLIELIILFVAPLWYKVEQCNFEQYILLAFNCMLLIVFLMEPFFDTGILHIPIFYACVASLQNNKAMKQYKISLSSGKIFVDSTLF